MTPLMTMGPGGCGAAAGGGRGILSGTAWRPTVRVCPWAAPSADGGREAGSAQDRGLPEGQVGRSLGTRDSHLYHRLGPELFGIARSRNRDHGSWYHMKQKSLFALVTVARILDARGVIKKVGRTQWTLVWAATVAHVLGRDGRVSDTPLVLEAVCSPVLVREQFRRKAAIF